MVAEWITFSSSNDCGNWDQQNLNDELAKIFDEK